MTSTELFPVSTAKALPDIQHDEEAGHIKQNDDSDAFSAIDPKAENKLRRKLDMRILPWIMLLYFLSYLDR